MNKASQIISVGAYLPENIVTNKDLESRLDTSDEWIQTRTGIKQRHIAAQGEFTSHLATKAAEDALKKAGIKAGDIDQIIVATTTPDYSIGSTACIVQANIAAHKAHAFDVNAACSGFIYGLQLANDAIIAGSSRYSLVIGAETMTRVVDWEDRSTCVLFGDGAGAAVLAEGEGILDIKIESDGSYIDILRTNGGVSSSNTSGHLLMEGKEVFKHATAKMADAVEQSLTRHGMNTHDIDLIVGHQANLRILSAVAKKLDLPQEKLISTMDLHANTSSASIPLALNEALKQGKIVKKNIIALPALGAGLTWGNCLVNWSF